MLAELSTQGRYDDCFLDDRLYPWLCNSLWVMCWLRSCTLLVNNVPMKLPYASQRVTVARAEWNCATGVPLLYMALAFMCCTCLYDMNVCFITKIVMLITLLVVRHCLVFRVVTHSRSLRWLTGFWLLVCWMITLLHLFQLSACNALLGTWVCTLIVIWVTLCCAVLVNAQGHAVVVCLLPTMHAMVLVFSRETMCPCYTAVAHVGASGC